MSWYRALRLAALVSLLRRYRAPLMRVAAAIAFALVTAWLYADVADYLNQHQPQWVGPALLLKTLIVYAALFWCFFELGRLMKATPEPVPTRSPAQPSTSEAPKATQRPLDRLAEKPQLRSRRDEVLQTSLDGNKRR